ncbi:unnamed protein product [Vicia faba]|uniref:F-box domain-containing protein n=1 Tax=Vicia faba TaxID=3906 RepID=A0AAV1B4P5_VICFA|nr:unnamed protein product [Vicia faba]CAI8616377.1 unnamed protein product [Vicia faba]
MAKSLNEKVKNYIPNDLVFSILSKLPLKSLKRFRCVHKTWSVLFENPIFMNKFRTNLITIPHSYYDDTSILLNQYVYDPDNGICRSLYLLSGERFENRVKLDFPNPFKIEEPQFDVLQSGSITGILCLYSSYPSNEIVLWNPTINEFKVIPHSSVDSVPPYRHIHKEILGFGYDPISEDYKIITYVYFSRVNDQSILPPNVNWEDFAHSREISYEPVWEIYSLRCNFWKKIDIPLPICCYCKGEGLYMDGICHWPATCEDDGQHYLVSFYLNNEVCFITPIPIDINFDENYIVQKKLLMLNGSLACILWYKYTTTYHILFLGELGVKESWTKLFVIELSDYIGYPIGVAKKCDIFFLKRDGELVYFDLCTEMIEKLGCIKRKHYSTKIIIYKKNLVSIEK